MPTQEALQEEASQEQVLREEAVMKMADNYISQTNLYMNVDLKRGPAAVEWMATQIPRLRLLDDATQQGIALAMGSLLGESIVTTFGGKWRWPGWEVHLPSGTIVRPVEMVKTQMGGGTSIYAVFQKLGQKNWWQFWKR